MVATILVIRNVQIVVGETVKEAVKGIVKEVVRIPVRGNVKKHVKEPVQGLATQLVMTTMVPL